MEIVRQITGLQDSLAVIVDDAEDETEELTPKQERFAQVWAATDNQSVAYRRVYVKDEKTQPQTIWGAASRMASVPKVIKRYKELREISLRDSIYTIRELFQLQVDIATADPNDLVRKVARCCRHCFGIDYRYQWRDEDESFQAELKAVAQGDALPDTSGGYGFVGSLEPNPVCPHCYGSGIQEVIIADTTKLTGKAKRLYAGAKQDRYGCIEIKMHDQQKAAEMAGRMLGAFDDRLDLRTPAEREKAEQQKTIPADITEDAAVKAYIDLMR